MNKILFATGNEGKMSEIRAIMSDMDVEICSMKEAGIDIKIKENGKTFEQNAIIKVKALRPYSDAIILADDSGLEVDYLDKEPGVFSARYMGVNTDYIIKNNNIVGRLTGVKDEERSARFVCVIAALLPDGKILTTEGTMEGRVAYKPAGTNGFGFDPILYLPEYGMTSAELSPEEKNKISHRGKALRAMKEKLKEYLV